MTALHSSVNHYMPSRLAGDTWDFTEVHELLSKLSTPSPAAKQRDPIASHDSSLPVQELPDDMLSANKPAKHTEFSGLGDLRNLWDFLGASRNTLEVQPRAATPALIPAKPSTSPPAPVTLESIQDRETYASDGAIDCMPSSKSIKWRDEVNGQEIADPPCVAPPETPLTKNQRKKLRRKQTQRERQEKLKSTSDAESETDVQQTPARKASVHTLAGSAQPSQQTRYDLRSKTAASTPTTKPTTKPAAAKLSAELASLLTPLKADETKPSERVKPIKAEKPEPAVQPAKSIQTTPSEPPVNVASTSATPATPKTKPLRPPKSPESKRRLSSTVPVSAPATPFIEQAQHLQQTNIPFQQPLHAPIVALGQGATTPSMIPYIVNPGFYAQLAAQSMGNPQYPPAFQHSQALKHHMQTPAPAPAPVNVIPTPVAQQSQKLALRQGADRHYHFLLKVIRNFGEDMKWLVSPAQSKDHNTSPTGIHVFVDASNILIGFYERLRYAKGIPKEARMTRPEFDFDALVLLLERRRPVAKRVLAGSNPYVPTFEKANSIGYELNILDKVKKAKELTERQKFFQQRDLERGHGRRCSHSGKENASAGSGSETIAATGPTSAPEKWVEQGVDEILHLKILESVVDVDVPSTIVLATGDAAEAEYSQGFLKMVERALRKGWKVEIVAWGKSISFAYRDKAFVQKWGDRFRIIELDDYVEDLLDV
ncbi:hypothetical protein W97_03022 [Coniosporium apollinis CBS 100218]|uniref:NYN domain-containing protein n=1 Tax=Coniosporium apollinis (strain CBS 100218) TaxID=1168221 RepID=R7YPP5_CONA1|nr:uncharacterized protein W97_03022 [Coniosporium apollinis CBS 100218]EON63794.1 hypothetical protein W97_03022 [Coniosporium apollinis CBS 100218]